LAQAGIALLKFRDTMQAAGCCWVRSGAASTMQRQPIWASISPRVADQRLGRRGADDGQLATLRSTPSWRCARG
jgi:hypothetical protein